MHMPKLRPQNTLHVNRLKAESVRVCEDRLNRAFVKVTLWNEILHKRQYAVQTETCWTYTRKIYRNRYRAAASHRVDVFVNYHWREYPTREASNCLLSSSIRRTQFQRRCTVRHLRGNEFLIIQCRPYAHYCFFPDATNQNQMLVRKEDAAAQSQRLY